MQAAITTRLPGFLSLVATVVSRRLPSSEPVALIAALLAPAGIRRWIAAPALILLLTGLTHVEAVQAQQGCVDLAPHLGHMNRPLDLCSGMQSTLWGSYWGSEQVEEQPRSNCHEAETSAEGFVGVAEWVFDSEIDAGTSLPGGQWRWVYTAQPASRSRIVVERPTWPFMTGFQLDLVDDWVARVLEHERGHLHLAANVIDVKTPWSVFLGPFAVSPSLVRNHAWLALDRRLLRSLEGITNLYDTETDHGALQDRVGGEPTTVDFGCHPVEVLFFHPGVSAHAYASSVEGGGWRSCTTHIVSREDPTDTSEILTGCRTHEDPPITWQPFAGPVREFSEAHSASWSADGASASALAEASFSIEKNEAARVFRVLGVSSSSATATRDEASAGRSNADANGSMILHFQVWVPAMASHLPFTLTWSCGLDSVSLSRQEPNPVSIVSEWATDPDVGLTNCEGAQGTLGSGKYRFQVGETSHADPGSSETSDSASGGGSFLLEVSWQGLPELASGVSRGHRVAPSGSPASAKRPEARRSRKQAR